MAKYFIDLGINTAMREASLRRTHPKKRRCPFGAGWCDISQEDPVICTECRRLKRHSQTFLSYDRPTSRPRDTVKPKGLTPSLLEELLYTAELSSPLMQKRLWLRGDRRNIYHGEPKKARREHGVARRSPKLYRQLKKLRELGLLAKTGYRYYPTRAGWEMWSKIMYKPGNGWQTNIWKAIREARTWGKQKTLL